MEGYFFIKNPSTHTVFNVLNALLFAGSILWASCFEERSVCFRLIGSLTSAPPESDKPSLLSHVAESAQGISGNGVKSVILVTFAFRSSAGGWNHFVGRLISHLRGAPE
jgi:hypothetical protein